MIELQVGFEDFSPLGKVRQMKMDKAPLVVSEIRDRNVSLCAPGALGVFEPDIGILIGSDP
jgi:hypothetical protein